MKNPQIVMEWANLVCYQFNEKSTDCNEMSELSLLSV